MNHRVILFGLGGLLILGLWWFFPFHKYDKPIPANAPSDVNDASLTLNCGAVPPTQVNSVTVFLACPTPVDLGNTFEWNNATVFACAQPSRMPKFFMNSTLTVVTREDCDPRITLCHGPSSCSPGYHSYPLDMQAGTLKDMPTYPQYVLLDCNDSLPCHLENVAVTILCRELTDLSAIQYVDQVTFYMHRLPCKYPQHFGRSSIVLY
jgi:hypothetical protein